MSDATTSSEESPIAKAMNSILMLGVPALLLGMLGISGIFFVTGMGDTADERDAAKAEIAAAQPAAPAAGAAAPAPAPAAGGGGAPAPAPAAAEGGSGISPEVMQLGKATFATCAACHGPDGKGLQAGPALMAPSFHGSKLLNDENPDKAILVVLKGIQKESMDFLGIMAPLGAGLSDEQIAAVLTYLRNDFDNHSSAVTPEQVAKAREKFASVNAPAGVKRSEIDAIVAGAN